MQKTPTKLEKKSNVCNEVQKNQEENTNENDELTENNQEVVNNLKEEDTSNNLEQIINANDEETPQKQEGNTISNESITPEKQTIPKQEDNQIIKNNHSTPLKELREIDSKFKTPEKSHKKSFESKVKEITTPEKSTRNDFKLDQISSCDGEDGMISTTEQARLLIAASKTPSKSINKTPVKQSTPSGKRSLEGSPVTPGKHRRVELITLASPKAKRIKQI